MPSDPRYSSARWQKLRKAVKARDGHACTVCGRTDQLDVDHVRAVADGGAFWAMDNLVTRCRKCHTRKTGANIRARNRRRRAFATTRQW